MMHKRALIAGIILAICLQACGKVTDDGTAAPSQVSTQGQTTLVDAADSGASEKDSDASEKDSGASEKDSGASDQGHTSPETGSLEKSEASSEDLSESSSETAAG